MTTWDWTKAGYGLGVGLLLSLAIFAASVVVFNHISPRPYDDTDARPNRSGLRPMTDARTGCQYLKSGSALTPRLDAEGRQICVGTK